MTDSPPASPATSSKLRETLREVSQLQWPEFHWQRGLRCLPAVAIALVVGLLRENPVDGLLAAAGAVSAGFGSFQTLYGSRFAPMLLASVGIALSALVGTLTGHSDAGMIITSALWAFGAGLLTSVGPGAAFVGTQCVVFLLVATNFPTGVKTACMLSSIVLAGALLQTAIVTAIRLLHLGPRKWVPRIAKLVKGPQRGARLALHTVRRSAGRRSDAFRYAMRLSATLAVAAGLSRLSANPHSYWMPVTAVIILQPQFRQTLTRAVSRTIGTVLGAVVSTLIAAHLRPSQPELVCLVVLFAWGSYSFLRVNYLIFAACLTSYLVFLIAMVGLPEQAAAATRAIYTALGACVALAAYATYLIHRRRLT